MNPITIIFNLLQSLVLFIDDGMLKSDCAEMFSSNIFSDIILSFLKRKDHGQMWLVFLINFYKEIIIKSSLVNSRESLSETKINDLLEAHKFLGDYLSAIISVIS